MFNMWLLVFSCNYSFDEQNREKFNCRQALFSEHWGLFSKRLDLRILHT